MVAVSFVSWEYSAISVLASTMLYAAAWLYRHLRG